MQFLKDVIYEGGKIQTYLPLSPLVKSWVLPHQIMINNSFWKAEFILLTTLGVVKIT